MSTSSRQMENANGSHRNTAAFFKIYRDLLDQKKALDKDCLKLDGKLLAMQQRLVTAVSKSLSRKTTGERKTYVERKDNDKILIDAIHFSMIPSRPMKMKEIIKELKRRKLYMTNSKYFYTMVNNKLNSDPDISKPGRGLFVYRPRKRSRGPSKTATA